MSPRVWLIAAALTLGACDPNPALETAVEGMPTPGLPTIAPPGSLNLYQVTGIIPQTDSGRALAWTLERLNLSPEAATAEAITLRFDPNVLEQVSAELIAGQIRELGSARPFAFVGFAAPPTPTRLEAAVMSARRGYQRVTVELGPTGRIKVLLFEPLSALPEGSPRAPEGDFPENTEHAAWPTPPMPTSDAPPSAPTPADLPVNPAAANLPPAPPSDDPTAAPNPNGAPTDANGNVPAEAPPTE